MAGRTAGPIKTKLGIGTHVDLGSVLVKVKVKVIWRHLANANKTPYRGPQGRDNRARSAINLRPEDGYLQLVKNRIACSDWQSVSARKVCNSQLLQLLRTPPFRVHSTFVLVVIIVSVQYLPIFKIFRGQTQQ